MAEEKKTACIDLREYREYIEKGIKENAERMKAEWLAKGYTKEQVDAMAKHPPFPGQDK